MEESMPAYGCSGTGPTLRSWIIRLLSLVNYHSDIPINTVQSQVMCHGGKHAEILHPYS